MTAGRVYLHYGMRSLLGLSSQPSSLLQPHSNEATPQTIRYS